MSRRTFPYLAIASSKATQAAHLVWVPISPRRVKALLEGTAMKLAVVLICALILDVEKETRGTFFDDIQHAIYSVSSA